MFVNKKGEEGAPFVRVHRVLYHISVPVVADAP